MHRSTKVATCCYCGTRAALVLDGARHELTCSACGAPLHDLKRLPIRDDPPRPRRPAGPPPREARPRPAKPKKRKPRKRRKSLLKTLWDEAEDLIEEIFD